MDAGLVTLDSSIIVELRYATTRNITGKPFYPPGARALLRREAADALARVQTKPKKQGVGLKVWDAYRPATAQKALWDACPNDRWICPPQVGSKHSRGCAVDLTLVDLKTGEELEMPTDHDAFTDDAASKSDLPSPQARRHRTMLQMAMNGEGWVSVIFEWWHFDWPGWQQFPLLDTPLV